MKKILAMVLITMIFTGCETVKYAVDQTFGDQKEYGSFQSKVNEPVPQDNMLALADDWVKKHLW